jgi:uncharacterized protein YecT (DUF1311 family)
MTEIQLKIFLIALIFFATTPMAYGAATSTQDLGPALEHLYGLRHEYTLCLKNAQAAVSASRNCMNAELNYQNKRLNMAYKALIDKLNVNYQAKLKSEEKIWIEYRDTHCASNLDGIDGPELDGLECTVEKTADQASDLEARLFLQQ